MDEFNNIKEALSTNLLDQELFTIYVDDALATTRMYASIQEIIDSAMSTYGHTIDFRIKLLSERVATEGEPELILALEGTMVDAENVYWFSKKADDYTFDIYLFGLFFESLLYKGVELASNRSITANWLNRVGNISFHGHLKEFFNPAVVEHIKERVFRTAA